MAGALVTASLFAAACGSSEPPTVLDTEKVERAIERSSLAQRGTDVQVSCPSGVHQRKGLSFSCKGGGTRFAVNQLNGSGRVRYEGR